MEALYGQGNQGLKSQLLEKSESYLGVRAENKKKFSWMYDFRSRFIHGDLDFIFSHNDFSATEEYGRFIDELWESEILATVVLLATLQKMCSEGRYDLEFRYQLVPSRD